MKPVANSVKLVPSEHLPKENDDGIPTIRHPPEREGLPTEYIPVCCYISSPLFDT